MTGKELDRGVHQQLRTLSKENAEGVAKHLVMVAAYLEADELNAALAHAETAVRRAGRVPAAREALGMVAYRSRDFGRALTEFRTVRRLSGSSHLLPLMVDCERGLGRHTRALELAASPEASGLAEADRVELAIVVSGVRRDLGQPDAALLALQVPTLRRGRGAGLHRLEYAYADVLVEQGRPDEAREWFQRAVDHDADNETDAVERLEELDGIVVTQLADDDAERVGAETPDREGPSAEAEPPGREPAGAETEPLDREVGGTEAEPTEAQPTSVPVDPSDDEPSA
ncbi:tetratricopeptide repeat protein [Phycicoccus sp. CSK15P-2]|uniref:tetratricopeptide repeat protein n=1 Tax=Phycicoccus sp. CSK15P-2 TaxID=2807627 RepID=UPI00194FCF17|nr:tetratricopeptide repeat protein [Phycicoccus sp. CSK15P-2]MBM6403699.1 tetratricopeptide repeat protein [Phycicoccus sp. CSK15P-2]